MASLATDQAESIDVIKTEDLFFELLEGVAVTNKYTLNTEFKNLSTSLKQKIDNLFIKKETKKGSEKTKDNETVELIMARLLKHMEEIKVYSFIIKEIKEKISGKYSFEELRDYNEMQIYRETLQNFIKKYIEARIKSKEKLSQSSQLSKQSEISMSSTSQGATRAYSATNRPIFNQNRRNIRRNLIDEFNAESDKKNINKKRKRGGKKRRNNKKTKKRKSKKRKSRKRKSRKKRIRKRK